MERGCLAAVGVVIALVSAFFVAAALVEAATGGDGKTSPGVYAGLVVFFGGTFAGGAYLVWRMLQKRPAPAGAGRPAGQQAPAPPTEADRERQVLRFAESEHGRVTIPEVAARSNSSFIAPVAALLREGVADGSFEPIADPRLTAIALLGMISTTAIHVLALEPSDSSDSLASLRAVVVPLVLDGLRARGAP